MECVHRLVEYIQIMEVYVYRLTVSSEKPLVAKTQMVFWVYIFVF